MGKCVLRITLYIVALTFAGCTRVGPDFEQPEVAVNAEWELFESKRIKTAASQPTQWWKSFNDPALDALVEQSYNQNLGLEAAGLRVLEARAQLGIAAGSLYPQQQSAGAGAIYTDRGANAGNLSNWQYNLDLNVGWELDFWGRFRRGVESADAAFFSSIANYDAVLVLLVSQVVDTYIVIRATEEQLRIARENVVLQQRSFDITDNLYRNGEKSELDRQQALTLLLSTEATIPGLQITLEQSRNALSILLGQPPGEINQLIGSTGPIPESPLEVAVGIPADLLRRRPDVRQAELQAAAQSARIGVATADLYPSFVLTGSFGLATTSDGGSLFESESLQFTGGPVINWPLLNYGRIRNNIRVQDARFQQTVVNYENTILSAAREVEDAITGYVRGLEQQEILERGVAAAQRSTKIALLRYQEGFSDYQRVLNAQQSLFAQQTRYVSSRGNTVRSLTALHKALGGGWEIRSGNNFVDVETMQIMDERTNWGDLLQIEQLENPDKVDRIAPSPDW
jgi:NodT family efflux transporter outer membrane factor (OMF) lipoprotein